MNKQIKLTWDTLQIGIDKAEKWGVCKDEIKELKQIKTLAEFIEHRKAPEWLCFYGRARRKGRIEAFEAIISTHLRWSSWYCRYVAKCRVPAMEEIIKQDDCHWERYLTLPEERK